MGEDIIARIEAIRDSLKSDKMYNNDKFLLYLEKSRLEKQKRDDSTISLPSNEDIIIEGSDESEILKVIRECYVYALAAEELGIAGVLGIKGSVNLKYLEYLGKRMKGDM